MSNRSISTLLVASTVIVLWNLSIGSAVGLAADRDTQGFVEVGRAEPLYVDYYQVDNASTTVVILNGLTYSTENWDQMMPYLVGRGYSIVRYDMRGQGKTIAHHGPELSIISYEDQVQDLQALLNHFGLQSVDLLALSYGGGIGLAFAAQYPERVKTLTTMSPFVGPDTTSLVFIGIQNEVAAAKLANPFLSLAYTDEQLFQYYFGLFYYSTAGVTEPELLTTPFILQSTLMMTDGLWTNAKAVAEALPSGKLNYVIGDQDIVQSRSHYDSFWNMLPASAKASRININGALHKIPESVPAYAAAWFNLILNHDPRISGGVVFEGEASTGTARSAYSVIHL